MKYLGYIIDVIGIVTLIIGLYFFIKAKKQVKIENKRKRDKLEKPYVVVIGGGTGQSIFLRGLKKITPNMVLMWDQLINKSKSMRRLWRFKV